jgi:hypothetical protein
MAKPLINSLRRIRRRLLLVRAMEAGLLGAIAAAPVAAAVTALRILRPESVPLAAGYPALPLALVACGFALGFLVRLVMGVSLRQAAVAADHAAGLKERLATALEVLGREPPGALDERLAGQAAQAAAALDPSRLSLARTAGRSLKVLLAAVLVLAAAALVPPAGGPPVARQAAERAADALGRWAAEKPEAVSPEVRGQIARTIQALTEAGLRRSTADETTREAVATAVRVVRSRRTTLEEFQKDRQPRGGSDGPRGGRGRCGRRGVGRRKGGVAARAAGGIARGPGGGPPPRGRRPLGRGRRGPGRAVPQTCRAVGGCG